MTLIKYVDKKFNPERRRLIDLAVDIVADYRRRGYSLTLRQLYYQMVARDLFPESWKDEKTGSTNNKRSYDKLGDIISDARLAGIVSWEAIEDRTREVDGNNHWESPADIVQVCARQFMFDKWVDQPNRIEVWVEKDALEGVVGQACRDLDVSFFSCRGYASMTSLWDAGQRLRGYADKGQSPYILHLGDHDPSGIDMTRDILDRVRMFMGARRRDTLTVHRIALNRDQITQYDPPPNPAKATDARYASYAATHGEECWELDALDPGVIDQLIRDRVSALRDDDLFESQLEREREARAELTLIAGNWNEERFRKLLQEYREES